MKTIHIDQNALEASQRELVKAVHMLMRGNHRYGQRWKTCAPTELALNTAETALTNAEHVYKILISKTKPSRIKGVNHAK